MTKLHQAKGIPLNSAIDLSKYVVDRLDVHITSRRLLTQKNLVMDNDLYELALWFVEQLDEKAGQ